MKVVKATVVKRNTSDGVEFLRDEVPIGFEYQVDADSIQEDTWLDQKTGLVTRRVGVMVLSGSATGRNPIGRMPLELLNLEEVSR